MGWLPLRSALAGAVGSMLLLTACGVGAEGLDDDEDVATAQAATIPSPTPAPTGGAIGSAIFTGLVEEGIGYASDPVVGWALSQVGIDISDPVEAKLDELGKKMDALSTQIDQLARQLDSMNCSLERSGLARDAVGTIRNSYQEYTLMTNPKRPDQDRKQWATSALNGDISKALTVIDGRLLNTDTGKESLLDICARDVMNNWEPSSAISFGKDAQGAEIVEVGKYGNDRFYYNSMYAIWTLYMDVQVLGTYLLVTANNLYATDFYKAEPTSGPLTSATLAQQVCSSVSAPSVPDANLPSNIPSTRESACIDARDRMILTEKRLRQQMQLIGASYSYAVVPNPDPQSRTTKPYVSVTGAEHISATKNLVNVGTPRVWMKSPQNYPNQGGTAAAARTLSTTDFGGISGWRSADESDWVSHLDTLGERFFEPELDGYLDRTFEKYVGFGNVANYPNNGQPAVIYMGDQTTQLTEPANSVASCLLIPYSQRKNPQQGLGAPICNASLVSNVLLSNFGQRASNQWLVNSTSGNVFTFGAELGGGGLSGEPIRFVIVPSWLVSSPGVDVSFTARSPQTIFPIKDITAAMCTTSRPGGPVTSTGVPTMCGENLAVFIDSVVTPIPKN